MPSYLQNLITTRDKLAAELAAGLHDHQPSYSEGGRTMDWNGYRANLVEQIEKLNLAIIRAQGAVEISTIILG